jgi:hypothetical protein
MTSLTESKKRDFITQLIVIIEQNAPLLTNKGFDPTGKLSQLRAEKASADLTEAGQREAIVAAKNATKAAVEALDTAYTDASATVDLISGLLGKNDNLLLEIKKLRKSTPPPSPENPA